MNAKLQWDDLRTVLAIAEAGSLSGAARTLAVSHATVFRRLNAIEKRLQVRLFDRAQDGYAATAAGTELASTAERIQTQVLDAERRLAGRDRRLSGSVRVTTTDTLLIGLCTPVFAAFRQAHPDITLEVEVSNRLSDLSRRDADIALRPGNTPPETLIGRKLATIGQAVYRTKTDTVAAASDDPIWVAPDIHMGYRALDRWMQRNTQAERCRYRVNTMLGMWAAVRDGIGCGVLPCYLADSDSGLERVGPPIPELDADLWLLTHADLHRVARIRAIMDFFAAALQKQKARITGRAD